MFLAKIHFDGFETWIMLVNKFIYDTKSSLAVWIISLLVLKKICIFLNY